MFVTFIWWFYCETLWCGITPRAVVIVTISGCSLDRGVGGRGAPAMLIFLQNVSLKLVFLLFSGMYPCVYPSVGFTLVKERAPEGNQPATPPPQNNLLCTCNFKGGTFRKDFSFFCPIFLHLLYLCVCDDPLKLYGHWRAQNEKHLFLINYSGFLN